MTKFNPITDSLPLLPLRDITLQPGAMQSLFVGRRQSVAAVESALGSGKRIFVVAQSNARADTPTLRDLHKAGTIADIISVVRLPDGTLKITLSGLCFAQLVSIESASDHTRAKIQAVTSATDGDLGARAPKGQQPDDIVEEILVENFDPAGKAVFRIERSGTIFLIFNQLPPSWLQVDRDEELRCLRTLDQGIIDAAQTATIWDNAETVIIEAPKPGAVSRIARFLEEYRRLYDTSTTTPNSQRPA